MEFLGYDSDIRPNWIGPTPAGTDGLFLRAERLNTDDWELFDSPGAYGEFDGSNVEWTNSNLPFYFVVAYTLAGDLVSSFCAVTHFTGP